MKDEKTESKPLSDEEIEEKTDIVDADIEKLKSLINDLTKARKKRFLQPLIKAIIIKHT